MHWCARKYRLAHVGVHINELVASNNLKKSQTYESLGIIILNIVENQQHHPLIKHGDGQSYTNESVYRKQICKHIKQKYWLYYVWVPESIWNRQPVLLLLQVALPLLPSVHAKTHLARLVGPKCRAAGEWIEIWCPEIAMHNFDQTWMAWQTLINKCSVFKLHSIWGFRYDSRSWTITPKWAFLKHFATSKVATSPNTRMPWETSCSSISSIFLIINESMTIILDKWQGFSKLT